MAPAPEVCPHSGLPLDPLSPLDLYSACPAGLVSQVLARIVGEPAPEHVGLFLWHCRKLKLSPFSGVLRAAVKSSAKPEGELDLSTTVEGYRTIAALSGGLHGIYLPTFFFRRENDGEETEEEDGITGIYERRVPFAALARVIVKGQGSASIEAIAFRSEWDTGSEQWLGRPRYQLALRAEGLALRLAFPELLHGIRLRSDGLDFEDRDTKPEKAEEQKPAARGERRKPQPRPTSSTSQAKLEGAARKLEGAAS